MLKLNKDKLHLLDNRTNFTFYRSFWEAISSLPQPAQLELYNAILCLSFTGSQPELKTATAKNYWKLIKPNVLKSLTNYINGCQRIRSDATSEIGATSSIDKDKDKELELDLDKDLKTKKIKEIKKKKKSAPNGSDVHDFIAHYCEVYKLSDYNINPVCYGQQAGAAKNIIKAIGLERAKIYAEAYLQMKDSWFVTKAHDLVTFAGNLNKIKMFVETGKINTRHKAQTDELLQHNIQAAREALNDRQ
jgi:hypothetical protein